MCNAAVTETLIEAINFYAIDHHGWHPEQIIPTKSWTAAKWSQLMPHLFSHDYIGYPPLETIRGLHIDIWPSLVKEIKNFHSEHGMSIALEKFGLGQSVRFEDARPGDIISFDRDWVGGGPGHSAIFLAFLTRDQKEHSEVQTGRNCWVQVFLRTEVQASWIGGEMGLFQG